MAKKTMILASVAVAIALILVVGVTSQDLTIDIPKEEQAEILKTKPTDIVDFDAVQFGNELSLSMHIGNTIPQTIEDIPLSDSSIGFAYGWLGEDKTIVGHLEGGSGHMQGYLVSMYHDTIQDGWKIEPVDADVISKNLSGADFCMNIRDGSAMLTLQDNTILVDTSPDFRPQVNAFFVDRALSLELGTSPWCHPRQIAAIIIDIIKTD